MRAPLADASLGDFLGATSDELPFGEQGGPLDVPSNTCGELSIGKQSGLLDGTSTRPQTVLFLLLSENRGSILPRAKAETFDSNTVRAPLAEASLEMLAGATCGDLPSRVQCGPLDFPGGTSDEHSVRKHTGPLDFPGTTSEEFPFGERIGP